MGGSNIWFARLEGQFHQNKFFWGGKWLLLCHIKGKCGTTQLLVCLPNPTFRVSNGNLNLPTYLPMQQYWHYFPFYTLLRPMCHKYFIQFIEDSRVNDFTFYILNHSIFSCIVINWLGQFKLSEMDVFYILSFTPCYLPGSQLFHQVEWWLKGECVYIFIFYIAAAFSLAVINYLVSLN